MNHPGTAIQAQASRLTRLCMWFAALIPALLISYSTIIDPIINFGLDPGFEFGGVSLGAEEKSTALTRIAIPAFLVAAVLVALQVKPRFPRRLFLVALPGLVFILMACLSALWARAPQVTLQLAIYQTLLFSTLLLSVWVAGNGARIVRCVLAVMAVVVALNLAAIIIVPPTPLGHAGIYDHKNTLGAAAGCAFLFGLFSITDPRAAWRLLGLFTAAGAAVLVVASDSKTVLMLIVVAPLAAIGIYTTDRLLRCGPIVALLLLAMVTVTGFLTIGGMLDFGYTNLVVALYGDTTFTGRDAIWAFANDYIQQSPIFGNGYRGFWGLGAASPKHGSEIEFIRTIGSGHSGFVDVTLDLGYVGLALVVGLIVTFIRQAGQYGIRPVSRTLLYLSLIILVVGRNAMESVILWSTSFDNLAFLLAGFLTCLQERNALQPRSGDRPVVQDLQPTEPLPGLLGHSRP